ncbi:Chaperone protein dnaJ 8, chloroplastic, partial [Ananas comosus]
MAISLGTVAGSVGSASSAVVAGEWRRRRRGGGAMTRRRGDAAARGGAVRCAAAAAAAAGAGSLAEQYRTLRIRPGATESEVKKAFRKLALQYHPDVCKGSNCGVQFHRINEAYETVMDSLRQAEEEEQVRSRSEEWHEEDGYADESLRGMCDPTWDLWEEWMGWEGA